MRFLLNVIWVVFGGLLMAIGYAIAGVICCVLIVTIPFGIAAFRLANYSLWPFGRAAVPKASAGLFAGLGNVVWFIVAGWWLALGHIISAIAQAITIIGIPLAIANIKLVPVALFPLGHEIVASDDLRERR